MWTSAGRRAGEAEDVGFPFGRQRRLRWPSEIPFSPARGNQATVLEEGVNNHGHQRIAMQTVPWAALEVVEVEFLLELLLSLLAAPARLDVVASVGKLASVGRLAR